MHIIFNAFSFLRDKLQTQGIKHIEAPMEIADGTDVHTLIASVGLQPEDVEAVFVNHTAVPKNTHLHEGDRVALLPPGTPGSYRLLSGLKEH